MTREGCRGLRLAVIGLALLAACAHDGQRQWNDEPPEMTPTIKPVPFTGIQRGINVGNWLEAPSPGVWGVIILPEHFTLIRQAGFDTVRLPVRFSAHAELYAPYTLDEDFMQVVDTAMQHGLENGLNVILDFHHFEALMSAPGSNEDRFLAIWDQLAERYRAAPDTLYFELLNEPHNKLDAHAWNNLARKAVQRIRASNPRRWIIIGGSDYSHISSLKSLRLPDDERLIATFHFYEPFELTHQGASWVAGSSDWMGARWEGADLEKEAIVKWLDQAVDWSRHQGVPLLMGEFGVIASADEPSRRAWTTFVAREASQRGIAWVYWDLCGEFRAFDCEAGKWDPSILDALTGR